MTVGKEMERPVFEKELYRMLVENTVDIVVHLDAALNRTYTSPSYKDVLGFLPEQLLGRSAFELVHPEDLATVRRVIGAMGPSNDHLSCTFRMRHHDGHYVWLEASYRWLRGEGGILAVLRDITGRRQAETRLTEAMAKLEAANVMLGLTLGHISQGVCFFDSDTRLVLCNRRYATLYGLPEELMSPGTKLRAIVEHRIAHGTGPLMSVDDYLAWRGTVNQRDQPFESELALQNGRLVLIHHHPMADGGYVATHEDITERRRTEEMLYQSQKLEAVGRLTGGIAHDFNNILQVIGPAVEMAAASLDADASPELRQIMADADLAVQHGGQLTRQLLSFSRKQVLRPAPLDMLSLISGMSGLLRQACGEAVRLRMESATDDATCMIDGAQFRSALLNLVINARDAMPAGGDLTIWVETVTLSAPEAGEASVAPGRYVRVAVRDTGKGIAATDLPHVFEPFYTTKGVGEGSGLGLPQVHGFVHQTGGSVSIASRPGGGTTVTMLLPCFCSEADGP